MDILKTLFLDDDQNAYAVEEIAPALDSIVPRHMLIAAAVLRVTGHDAVSSACPTLSVSLDGHPEALGAVLTAYFATTEGETIVADVLESIPHATLRHEWSRQGGAYSVGARDVLSSFHTAIAALAAKPVSEHRKKRAAERFEDLKRSKAKQADETRLYAARMNSHRENAARFPQQ
jgi:hypothetical protein